MGYNTCFNLSVSPKKYIYVIQELRNIDECANYLLDAEGYCGEVGKWEHEKALLEFSKKYPKVLFTLYGDGDASEDLWVQYFKNGMTQFEQARLIYPAFNKYKLV